MGTIERPSSGNIQICGKQINQMAESQADIEVINSIRNDKLGFVFMDTEFDTNVTAFETIEQCYTISNKIKGHDSIEDKTIETLTKVGLNHKMMLLPQELTNSDKLKLILAKAIVNDPEILFLDEPICDDMDEFIKILLEI